MLCRNIAALLCLTVAALAPTQSSTLQDSLRIPEGFFIATGTSAFQTEGAAKEDGKAESELDAVFGRAGRNGSSLASLFSESAVVTSDSYHHMDDDVELLRRLKFNAYRFSIAWTRVLPNGDLSFINELGVNYYRRLIDKLRAINVEPMVTLIHFDSPFNEKFPFTWNNPEMPDLFANYSRFVFSTFGDKVKYWTTVNEMDVYCTFFNQIFATTVSGYGRDTDTDLTYQCIRNHLLAHGKAYKIYKAEFNRPDGAALQAPT